jgi:hypothetical protein
MLASQSNHAEKTHDDGRKVRYRHHKPSWHDGIPAVEHESFYKGPSAKMLCNSRGIPIKFFSSQMMAAAAFKRWGSETLSDCCSKLQQTKNSLSNKLNEIPVLEA